MAGGLQSLPLTEEVKEEKSEESNFEKKRCRPIFIVGITLLQIGFFIYDHICITHFDVEKMRIWHKMAPLSQNPVL